MNEAQQSPHQNRKEFAGTLRPYAPADCSAILHLFNETVHNVNARDYTPAQLNVWATGKEDAAAWNQSLLQHHILVAWLQDKIVGFGDIDDSGYLDRLYVHKDYQGQGVAGWLCARLEATTTNPITVHASITAQPFFAKRGYTTIHRQQVERGGLLLTNFVMRKQRAAR